MVGQGSRVKVVKCQEHWVKGEGCWLKSEPSLESHPGPVYTSSQPSTLAWSLLPFFSGARPPARGEDLKSKRIDFESRLPRAAQERMRWVGTLRVC